MASLCLAAILSALATTRAPAAQDDEIRLNADFAWGRQYRPGSHNPVVITIDNPGPEVSGTLQLRWSWHPSPIVAPGAGLENLEGGTGSIHEVAVVIPKNSRRRYFVAVECPAEGRAGLWAVLTGSPRAPKPFGITATAIAPEDLAVALIGAGDAPGFSRAGAHLLLARADELPDRWHGYAPLDIAFWMEEDAAALDPDQIEALKRWIALGGHLIVARASAIGFAGTFLEELAGVRSKMTRPHHDWSPLAELAEIQAGPQAEAAILEVTPTEGTVLARAGDRPLIVRRRIARGQVTFLAFDPSTESFRDWSGPDRFWKRLAHLPDPAPQEPFGDGRRSRGGRRVTSFSSQTAQTPEGLLGTGGLAGHMMSQPGVPIPPIGAGLLLLVIYAALIGPVDYFVLRRLKRLHRTWITFPATAVAFALILVAVGFSMKRNAAKVRDVLVEDHLGEADLVRGWSLTTVTLPEQDVISARLRHRHGTLRSFDRQVGGAARVAEGRLEDWHFAYGSIGLAFGEWCEPGSRLRVEQVEPGRIRVVNDTGSALRHAVFAASGRLWTVGRIPEGESHHDLAVEATVPVGTHPQYGPRREDEWADFGRRILMQMALAPTAEPNRGARGFAAAMDLRPWMAQGGGVLMGWSEGAPVLELSRGSGSRPVYRLVRGFTRHD